MRNRLSACLFLSLSISLVAQQRYGKEMVPLAPDVWAFMKYGSSVQPDLYTGALHESIELYSYHDRDFNFPVHLNYATRGFMPNYTTGVAGLGWTLGAGGCITREIKQVQDEKTSGSLSGVLHMIRTGYDENILDSKKTFIDESHTGLVCYQPKSGEPKYETEPDVFSFSFMGHTGKFIIVRTGDSSFRCEVFEAGSSPGLYRITPENPLDGVISDFKVTTGDGFIYEFTHISEQDYSSVTILGGYGVGMEPHDTPLTWMLTKITSPTGRELRLNYELHINNSCVRPSASRSAASQKVDDGAGFLRNYAVESISSSTFQHLMFSTNAAVLKSVDVMDTGFHMEFFYGDRRKREKYIRSGSEMTLMPQQKQLDSIVVSDNVRKRPLRRIWLQYSHPVKGNPVLLLKQVHVAGLGSWRMDYYREDGTFPYQGTTSIDHWGFFNSIAPRYNIHELIPDVIIGDDNLDQTINKATSRREPDFTSSLTGVLKRLTYPTGGFSEYVYEQNSYSHSLRRDAASYGFLYPRQESSDNLCGGIRIHKIITNPMVRTYVYETGGRSSGVLERYPEYFHCLRIKDKASGYIYQQTSMASFCTFSYPLDAHDVIYPHVVEILGNGARTETYFTSVLDAENRDEYPEASTIVRFKPEDMSAFDMNNAVVSPDSRHYLRGRQKQIRHYSAESHEPWKIERYGYSQMSVALHDCYSCARIAVVATYPHRIFLQNTILKEIETVLLDGSDSLVTAHKFSYNTYGQLAEDRKLDYGLGTSTIGRTLYVSDLTDASKIGDIYSSMRPAGMEGLKVKEFTAFKKSADMSDSGLRLTSGTSYAYKLSNGKPLLHKVSLLKTGISASGPFPGFDYESDLYDDVSIRYDNEHRPVEETDRMGIKTTYLWGYGGMYPVAVLKNCSLETYLSSVGDSGSGTCFPGSLPESVKAILYADDRFETTVYDYVPHVGISCMTDQSGRTIYYTYDGMGRLIQLVNDRGQIVKSYKYHIETE